VKFSTNRGVASPKRPITIRWSAFVSNLNIQENSLGDFDSIGIYIGSHTWICMASKSHKKARGESDGLNGGASTDVCKVITHFH
jgi:hypothetical protein